MPVSKQVAPLRPIRVCGLLALAGAIAGLIVLGVSGSLDWIARNASQTLLGEMEEHALGSAAASPENFYPMQAVSRQPTVRGFEIVKASSRSHLLDDDEVVLALEINGHSRAYPINMLTGPSREIINDTLGGRSIAATW